MTSTLLFGLGMNGVTARLWNRFYGNNAPPESFDESIGYPGAWDVRATSPDEHSIGFQGVPGGLVRVWFRAPGYKDQKFDTMMPDDGAKDITMEKAPIALPRLASVSGHRFRTENGTPVYGKMADAFLLYKKWLDGQDITPFLAQHRDLGFNMLRVFGMFESLGGFNPKNYGDRYYDAMPDFFRLCESYGQYVYFVCCAATGGIMNPDEALRHTQRCSDNARAVINVLISWVNEQGQHNNSVDRDRFAREVNMNGLLWDSGSFGVDETCKPPFGTHACLHSRGDFPACVKDMATVDNGNFVHDGKEVVQDEPGVRFGDEGKGDGHNDPLRAAEMSGTAWTAPCWCFHSMQGEKAETLTGNTYDCAVGAVTGMRGF